VSIHFFSSRRQHTRCYRDWSSDVCSSDLVDIREAFNQINRYERDSFWAGSGLFAYVQLFVISNGTLTKYYSNTTRRQHLQDTSRSEERRVGKEGRARQARPGDSLKTDHKR